MTALATASLAVVAWIIARIGPVQVAVPGQQPGQLQGGMLVVGVGPRA